jgi:hypothetical protein
MKPHAYFPMESFWEKDGPIVFVATSPKEGLETRLSRLTYEKEQFLMELPHLVRACDSEKRQLFIQQQLSHYGDIVAQLLVYRETLPDDPAYEKIAQFCEDEIALFESILLHIQKEYRRYIDQDNPMPAGQLLKVRAEIKVRVAALRKVLAPIASEIKLLDIALDPYERHLEEPAGLSTYRQYYYCLQYLGELEMIKPDDDIDCKLRTALVYMNFNTRAFLHYCYKNVRGELKSLVSTAEKLDKLEELQKIFTQLQTKPGCEYTAMEPSTVSLLLRIVKGEKKHIRKQKKIYQTYNPTTQEDLPASSMKLKTSLTVEQFGAILKLFYVTGTITNKTQMDFLRLFASVLQTEKKDVISVDSLRSKYHVVSPEMKIWLGEKFREWGRNINNFDKL